MIDDNDEKFPGNIFLNSKLSCGKSIIELSKFDNSALWWFVAGEFQNVFQYLVDRNDNRIIQLNIKGKVIAVVSETIPILPLFFEYSLKVIIKLTILYITPKKNDIEKLKILFTGQDLEWRHILDENGDLRVFDRFHDDIIKNIQKRKEYSLLSVFPLNFPFHKSYPIFIDKLLHWDVRYIPFNLFYNTECYKKRNVASHHFKKIWETIVRDPAFEQLLKKYGNNNDIYLKRFFKNQFTETFPTIVAQIQMATNLIKKEHPALILLVNEFDLFERALLIAGRLNNVPVLVIQHGFFCDPPQQCSAWYMYQKGEIAEDLSIASPYVQVGDKFAAYGEYHKELLTKVSSYPEKSVIVTGQPRYDSIIKFDSIFNRKKFLSKWKINPKNKIIVWTTACQGISDNENFLNFDTVFNAITKLKNVTLIIKQHVGESKRYLTMINDYLLKYHPDVIIVPKTEDAMELMYHSDLVITKNSTTGLEAIALNKPLIVLNLSGQADVINYVEAGVAVGVYSCKDLVSAIQNLLSDDHELKINRNDYLAKYLYKIDGKATERVVKLIDEMISKNAIFTGINTFEK